MADAARDVGTDLSGAAGIESRRSLLRRSIATAAAAAAGAVAVQAAALPRPVGAANGGPVTLGAVNTATAQTAVVNFQAGGRGLTGRASSTTQSAGSMGVYGQSDARLGYGVYGLGHTGVYGRGSALPNSWGVGGKGVYGVVGQGTVLGVQGEGPQGVVGYGSGSLGKGVYGTGDYGVYGRGSYNSASWGVYGTGPLGVVGDGTQTGVLGRAPRGVQGNGSGVGGAGVFGQGDYGVYAVGNYNANSWGVYGAGNYGVVGAGQFVGTYGSGARGLYGLGTGSGGFGAYATGPFGVVSLGANVGVQGEANGTGGTGVLGIGGPGNGYGGFFRGNVGTTAQFFSMVPAMARIDHPLDPGNRFLVHAAVHSPEMLNVYSGSVTLGPRGTATVRLPRYDVALNTDHRIQLTPVGAAAPGLHVAQEVANGRFAIAGGAAGQRVYWQVSGVRNDRAARKHKLNVEALKRPAERGKYLAPELYGERQSAAIGPKPAKVPRRDRSAAQEGRQQGPRLATLPKVRRGRPTA